MTKQRKITKGTKIVLVCVIVLIIGIVSAGTALAIWSENQGESTFLQFYINKENPSLRYQIFIPIDENGKKVAGGFYGNDILSRSYTLTNSNDRENIVGYAFVGYDGATATTRLEIPETYAMQIDGILSEELPTMAVMVDSSLAKYELKGNVIITDIIIPQSITRIESGVFSFMSELHRLQLVGDGDINIADYAFANCPKLNYERIELGNRTIVGNENLILYKD